MANKIYDFLPGHLKNSELETIFETTLERVFSKGDMEKVRAYVGRKEKGINSEQDIYLSYPPHAFTRENYGLEPVYSSDEQKVFYEDLLNSLFNKGALTNDHRRLFDTEKKTINIPIDLDKFVNWSMYYWVKPGFVTDNSLTQSNFKHYVTVGRPGSSWFSVVNSWYHYDDIRDKITDDNYTLIEQAKRPIIEFDNKIELADSMSSISSWEFPKFKMYDQSGTYITDAKIFSYTVGDSELYQTDQELGFIPVVKSGDYTSEYCFETDVPDDSQFHYVEHIKNLNTPLSSINLVNDMSNFQGPAAVFIDNGTGLYQLVKDTNYTITGNALTIIPDSNGLVLQDGYIVNSDDNVTLDVPTGQTLDIKVVLAPNNTTTHNDMYIKSDFDYRNYRKEFGRNATRVLTLSQTPKNSNAVDVYIDGIKQINNYTVSGNDITFNVNADPVGFVHVDICTNGPVTTDGDTGFQRLHHSLEYNVDNKTYLNTQIPYSTWYEHFLRIIETTPGLSGEPNGVNNYRELGNNTLKTRHNNQGSVMVVNSVDVRDAYFSLSRDDYDPIKSFEFLSTAYQGYKNKFITTVRDILSDPGGDSKTSLEILEEAIANIGLSKRQSISIFDNLLKINYGEIFSNYSTASLDIVLGTKEQFIPTDLGQILNDKELTVIKNDVVLKLGVDYTISTSGEQINFIDDLVSTDTISLRKYDSVDEAYIPPSSTFLKINPAFIPGVVLDGSYTNAVEFIQGHDGSITPKFGDRTDDILLMFETLIWNSLDDNITRTNVDRFNYGPYSRSSADWELYEKNYTMYPFFKKWMIRNNIDNLYNTDYDPNDWKTWNYRTIDADSPGHWRGIYQFAYNTDNPLFEPWKVVGLSQEPADFKLKYGTNSNTYHFWSTLFTDYNITNTPIPVDSNGDLKPVNELFFNSSITSSDVVLMKEDWEFGDGSPTEMAWRRSSEYPFIEFILMMLTKPFKVFHEYKDQVTEGIRIHNKKEGSNTTNILQKKQNYDFKLGSKLGGFVNNFRLLAENTSLNNSRYTDVPKDNFDLVIHAGEPNRSEFFSAIIIEKVSLDDSFPVYLRADTSWYQPGDIVLNSADGKYYRRKQAGQTQAEQTGTITFDYSAWTMISQPKTRKYGYRIQGYDDINPTFFAMEWDKVSGEKAFSTKGDRENLNEWQQGAFYRKDSYMKYEGQPYVCLREHTSTTLLDDNIEDWKKLVEWPRTNKVTANGYKEFKSDQIKNFNYGQILENIDDVAHLMLGYQKYLEFIGWGFTDIDEQGQTVDFEQLLYKFLEWSSENHGPGEFITLSPMLVTGSFTAPYGVASVRRETFKNFYRVVDASGRLVPDNQITFTTDGKTINFRANVPVYGMKIDIQDVEHAFVVDRVDSFGDVIYDPFLHDRNLRMQIDCNKSRNWDGTLTVDGYLPYGDELIPNFETLTSDSKYFRDTLVDQNLEIVNKLKASQIGYTKKDYLRNHGIERESQLEFYKGFLSHKGTNSAVNRIVNNNGNFKDIGHEHIWAFKLAEYGKLNNGYKETQSVNTVDMISDPHRVQFDNMENTFKLRENTKGYPLKTTGYVDGKDVVYTVNTEYDLENIDAVELNEGDTAWIQFDPVRQWDVRRLSEVAEIGYVGETSDNQLYVGLTNQIDTTDSVYLKIKNSDIDPEVADYYFLVDNGTRDVDGVTVYEYLVFERNYEPLIVEIDNSSSNSLFVPTGTNSGVEAIGSVSYPVFNSGDELVIDGVSHVYTPGSGGGTGGLVIGGTTATVDPVVSEGEQARIIVYDSNGFIANTNTLITFDGTSASGTLGVSSVNGDVFNINGEAVTVQFSSTQNIEAITSSTETDTIPTGGTLVFNSTGEAQATATIQDIQHVGSTSNPELTSTKSLSVNGNLITFTVAAPVTGSNSVENFTGESTPVSSVTLTSNMTNFLPGTITVDNGDGATTLATSDYSYDTNTKVITFNSAIQDGTDANGLADISVQLVAQPVVTPMTTTEIVNTINSSAAPITASLNGSNQLVIDTSESYLNLSGSILVDLGLLTSGSSLIESKLNLLAQDINAVSYLTAFINANSQLEIETTNDDLTIGGTARASMGLLTTYDATTDPTAASIVAQINARGITGISATKIGSNIKIVSNSNNLDITETTSGALSRLGFATNPVDVDSATTIRDNINEALSTLSGTSATLNANRQIVITSDQASIVLENVSGNPWNDIGISVGTYNSSTSTQLASVSDFKDQINQASSDVLVSITSDGRMVFTNSNVSMSFSGTSQTVLDKIGLFREYTAVTSNNNFKAMRWKSVRYSQFYLFDTFDSFYNDLGLNAEALIWADDYLGNGWSVLYRDITGTLTVRNRQANTVEVDYLRRVIVKDGENFYNYQLFDPLNLKLPGDIIKNLDYITWEDPAGYDTDTSKELWLDQYIGQTWWDTSLARYYRYNDYGDANGRIVESFATKYWGKLVPGSEINVKKWTKSETLPEGIETYTTKVYFDTDKNRSVTEYFYWSEEGSEPEFGKTLSIEETKMLLESGNIKNKFIPIDVDKIIISNNAYVFNNSSVDVSVEYNTQPDTDKKHADWKLLQQYTTQRPDDEIIKPLIDSLAGVQYTNYISLAVEQSMLGDPDTTKINVGFLDSPTYGDATLNDTVVTVNNHIVDAQYITFFTDGNPANAQVRISKQFSIIVGDIVRVYRMTDYQNNWFKDLQSARENFASSVNAHFSKRHLVAKYPEYKEFIQGDNLILSLEDWYLTDEYKTIERFSYLSKTRTFDMLKLYNDQGVKSFKLQLPTHDEYYFEHEGTLRLVNSSKSALNVSFNDIVFPDNSTLSKKYYENAIGVQVHELFHLMLDYTEDKEINRIFFDMINYMYTEKTHPDWIFKTSYIDVNLFNRNLRKYAIYQRDSYDDVIEYITEAKPYHTKIREVIRYYSKEEIADARVSIAENMHLTLDFGNNLRYADIVKDGGSWAESEHPELEDGTYEQGRLLRTRYTLSDGKGDNSFDTGLVNADFRESSIVFVDQFTDSTKATHDKTFLYVYDMYGRGWKIDITGETTVASMTNDTIVVNSATPFSVASDENRKLIAIRNETTGDIEFMTYSNKDTVNLTISERGLYTGMGTVPGTTTKVYALGTPLEIVLHEMV